MSKTMGNTYKSCGLLLLVAFVFGIGFLLSSSHSSASSTSSTTANASVTVGSACTFTGTVSTAHNAEVPNGTNRTDIGSIVLNTICNDNGGFAIYAVGYSSSEYGNNTMINQADSTITFNTGTSTSGNNSNWSMKLTQVTTGTYATTIDNSFNSYHNVPATYTKVAHRDSVTDASSTNPAVGSSISLTYQTYISGTQAAGTYQGKVKFTMVHPATEIPPSPQPSTPGYINYYANATNAEGTMGRQPAIDGETIQLFASNFSREGYGFAGWSDAYDYDTNTDAHFYGPNEDIVIPTGTTADGLALYAIWVKSAGTMQANANNVCNNLTTAIYDNEDDNDESTWSIIANLSSVSALTDVRDGQTYAIAKLTDGKCWMIENLRLANTHQENGVTVPTTLTIDNTNKPLNDGMFVTIKHNYNDLNTFPTLSATSNVSYDADTYPEGWCSTSSAACNDQSRINTDNTTNRDVYNTTTEMTTHSANLYSYGNYYNWYSATAGKGTYSISNADVDGDLCPYGWHLPIGRDTGEFGRLSNSLGGYQNNGIAQAMSPSTSPTNEIIKQRLSHYPNNYIYSGLVMETIRSRGGLGYYWTLTASNNNHSALLSFSKPNSSSVYPGSRGQNKYMGVPIRCIAITE